VTELLAFLFGGALATIYWAPCYWRTQIEMMAEYLEHHKTKAALRLVESEYRQLSKGLYAILKGEHLE
jgi:hypothetical protein